MESKHQKYELNENIGEDELIRNLKVSMIFSMLFMILKLRIYLLLDECCR